MWFILFAMVARAGGLSPHWERPVRYHTEALISTPMGQHFISAQNLDARAMQTGVAVDLSCQGRVDGRVFDVDCVIDKASLEAVAYPGEQDKLNAIMAEYGQLLTGATLQLVIRDDGHIKLVDLEGVTKDRQRTSEVYEQMRQILRRSVAPLCLQMPKNGEDPGKPWKHKGVPLAFEMMTKYGTAGGTVYKYEIVGTQGDETEITAQGRANISTGTQLEASGSLGMNLIVTGHARFDTRIGLPVYSEVIVSGQSTASSTTVGRTDRYALAAWAGRIEEDGTVAQPESTQTPTGP